MQAPPQVPQVVFLRRFRVMCSVKGSHRCVLVGSALEPALEPALGPACLKEAHTCASEPCSGRTLLLHVYCQSLKVHCASSMYDSWRSGHGKGDVLPITVSEPQRSLKSAAASSQCYTALISIQFRSLVVAATSWCVEIMHRDVKLERGSATVVLLSHH